MSRPGGTEDFVSVALFIALSCFGQDPPPTTAAGWAASGSRKADTGDPDAAIAGFTRVHELETNELYFRNRASAMEVVVPRRQVKLPRI